jgi:hypothetical protein
MVITSSLATLIILLYTTHRSNSAAPTRPDQADPGSVPVTAPVNVKSSLLKLSPEQLVVASMPWEGMDQPEAQRRAIFPRQDPWDTAPDSTMHRPFGHYAAITAHPPPFIPGDVDTTNEELGKERLNEQDWMRQSRVPSLPAVGPAFYGRDMKPENYYLNPLAKHSQFAAPILSLLETKQMPLMKRRLRHRSSTNSFIETSARSTGNSYWNQYLQRLQEVGVHVKAAVSSPDELGGFDAGSDKFKARKFSIPPVAINKGFDGTPPALAVLGHQNADQTVAPRVQQFVGVMDWQKELKEGKPLPVRPYATDHPSGYQQQPLWPPAPPEPLFPLKDDRR